MFVPTVFIKTDGSFKTLTDLNRSTKATKRPDIDFVFGAVNVPLTFKYKRTYFEQAA